MAQKHGLRMKALVRGECRLAPALDQLRITCYSGLMDFTNISPRALEEFARLQKESLEPPAWPIDDEPITHDDSLVPDLPLDPSSQQFFSGKLTAHQKQIVEHWRYTYTGISFAVLDYLSKQTTFVTLAAIARNLGATGRQISPYLRAHIERGLVWKPERNRYMLNPTAFPSAPLRPSARHCATCTCES